MKWGAIVHGALLLLVLILGYRTLGDDGGPGEELGDVTVWRVPASSIEAISYSEDKAGVRVERRDADGASYLWGIQTRRADDPHDHGHGHDHGHDHHGHDHGGGEEHVHEYQEDYGEPGESDGGRDAAPEGSDPEGSEGASQGEDDPSPEGTDDAPEPTEDPEGQSSEQAGGDEEFETVEFPVGESGEELFELYAELTAIRDLGVPDDETREIYEDEEEGGEIIVHLEDGQTRALTLGDRVYGGADRYVFERESGRTYVLRSRVIRELRGGQSTLALRQLHDFDDDDVGAVALTAGDTTREFTRLGEDDGSQGAPSGLGGSSWADAAAPGDDLPAVATFLGQLGHVRPQSYAPDISKAEADKRLSLRFLDDDGEVLGTFELYAHPAGEHEPTDDADDGDSELAYYAWTERTRVLGRVSSVAAERLAEDARALASPAGDEMPAAERGEGASEALAP